MRTYARRTALVALAAAASLTLAACGGNESGGSSHHEAAPSAASPSTSAEHNSADVQFAQHMIVHHQQAITMARTAAERGSSPEVKDLAAKIEKAQAPEIETMTGWLKQWGEDPGTGMGGDMSSPMPSKDMSSPMPGMDHGSMPGMMSDEDMAELEKKSGAAFDTAFLTMMVEHHEGAVEMARTEQAKGKYGPAKALAANVISAQTTEIAQMKKMLAAG